MESKSDTLKSVTKLLAGTSLAIGALGTGSTTYFATGSLKLAFGVAGIGAISGLAAAALSYRGGRITRSAEMNEAADEHLRLNPDIEKTLQRAKEALRTSTVRSDEADSSPVPFNP